MATPVSPSRWRAGSAAPPDRRCAAHCASRSPGRAAACRSPRAACSNAGQFLSCSGVSISPALSPARRASPNARMSSMFGCCQRASAFRPAAVLRVDQRRTRDGERDGSCDDCFPHDSSLHFYPMVRSTDRKERAAQVKVLLGHDWPPKITARTRFLYDCSSSRQNNHTTVTCAGLWPEDRSRPAAISPPDGVGGFDRQWPDHLRHNSFGPLLPLTQQHFVSDLQTVLLRIGRELRSPEQRRHIDLVERGGHPRGSTVPALPIACARMSPAA